MAPSPVIAPLIIIQDLNKDKNKDLFITLTKGYGNGALVKNAHILNVIDSHLLEVLIDDPIAIVDINVTAKLYTEIADISIDGLVFPVDITPLNI